MKTKSSVKNVKTQKTKYEFTFAHSWHEIVCFIVEFFIFFCIGAIIIFLTGDPYGLWDLLFVGAGTVTLIYHEAFGYRKSIARGFGILHENCLELQLGKKKYLLEYKKIEEVETLYWMGWPSGCEIILEKGTYIAISRVGSAFSRKRENYSAKSIKVFQNALKRSVTTYKQASINAIK